MKVLFIGDCHLKINNFQAGLVFLSWLNSLIEEKKPDVVVNLGDFFNDHAVIRSEVMTEFMNHVNTILKLKIPYVYVVGNHCMFKPNDSKYHALKHLTGKIDNFHIIDKVTDLFDMTFVPYQPNANTFPKKTNKVCIAHQSFLGADYGAIVDKNGVDHSKIDGCELIVSGHIHKRQQLEGLIPVTYPGSPFSQSASDIDQVKGISILDTETYKFDFIESPLPKWRRVSVQISTDTDTDIFLNNYIKPLIGSKDHFVIELVGVKDLILKLMDLTEYKDLISKLSVSVKTTFTDKEKKLGSISSSFSVEKIISDYIDKIYSGPLNKEELKNKALDVFKTSNNTP